LNGNEADYLDRLPWTDPVATAATTVADAQAVFNSLTPPKKLS
jgi:hypothetical protein